MQPTPTQAKAAELVANGQVTFLMMTGHFTVAGVSVDGTDFYHCHKCGGNTCEHALAGKLIDAAIEKACHIRHERVIDAYIRVIEMAQESAIGFDLDVLEVERRAAIYAKKTARGMFRPISQIEISPYQAQRLQELGSPVAVASYVEAKAEILRLEWVIWEV